MLLFIFTSSRTISLFQFLISFIFTQGAKVKVKITNFFLTQKLDETLKKEMSVDDNSYQ